MFGEFEQIEWRARIEAIRERLDEQREQRQEQERAQEQADRQAAEQHEQEADRQAGVLANREKRTTTSLQWHGDRLLPGEHCESHLVEFRNVIELDDLGAYRYPNGYADAALRINAVDERPGSRAVKLLMLSLDRDLAADIQAKNGATADDDSQLYATPGDAPAVFARFRDATLPQLEDVLRRMATVSETVDTLITTFKGQVFEPGVRAR